jgi:hypothetical protein
MTYMTYTAFAPEAAIPQGAQGFTDDREKPAKLPRPTLGPGDGG